MNPPVKIQMKESICICLLLVFAYANSVHADTYKTYTWFSEKTSIKLAYN